MTESRNSMSGQSEPHSASPDARQSAEAARPKEPLTALVVLALGVIVASWCYFWIPSLINAVQVGRQYVELGDTKIVSATADTFQTVLQYALIVLILLSLLEAIRVRAHLRLGRILLLILPWGSIYAVELLVGGAVPWQAWLYPGAIAVLCVANLSPKRLYHFLAILIIVTALMSIVLGLIPGQPGLMPTSFHEGDEKALIGTTILAGPFVQSNQLGVTMALGLPIVALTYRGWKRLFALAPVIIALLWSASRTSIYATLVVLVVVLVVIIARRVVSRVMVVGAIIVATVVMVGLPLVTTNPLAFTNRGLVWQASFEAFRSSPATGVSSNAYMVASQLSLEIGAILNHGNNTFVTIVTIGGVIGLLGFAIFFLIVLGRAIKLYLQDALPALFLVTILLVSILEDPIRGLILAPSCFIVWPMLVRLVSVSAVAPPDSAQVASYPAADNQHSVR